MTTKPTSTSIAALTVPRTAPAFLSRLGHRLAEGRRHARHGAANDGPGLIERGHPASRSALVDQGRAVLAAMLER